MDENAVYDSVLPGFRFHPTEEELLDFYLRRTSTGKNICSNVIGFLNIYRHDPSELPGLAKTGEREWYFFVPRDRRNGHGGRPARTTEKGFWKATGCDRQIRSASEPKKILGIKKTLVFYRGRAPKGIKTDWVMNEYRLPDNIPLPKEDIVLCKIYRKATSLKTLEQRAAMEDQLLKTTSPVSSSPPSQDTPEDNVYESWVDNGSFSLPKINFEDNNIGVSPTPVEFGYAMYDLRELEVPTFTGGSFSPHLRSMGMEEWGPYTPTFLPAENGMFS